MPAAALFIAAVISKGKQVSSIQEELKASTWDQVCGSRRDRGEAGRIGRPGEGLRDAGLQEVHREEVLGNDQVREVLLQIGDGPNLIQLLEPLTADSPVQKLIERNGGRGGLAHVAFRVDSAQQAFDTMQAERISNHRQGAAKRLERDHGLLRPSQIESRESIRASD